ncbi:MAG: hypothetical protein IT453_07275 [Planctomycetes bacterium]|nr:hypothetical protein [Planctomycetota bacterium]
MKALALLTCSLVAVALANASAAQSIRIQAYVDGRSRLILDDDTATWQHFEWAAPGRVDCDTGYPIAPTYLDGLAWWPDWPDVPTCENRDCGGCSSSTFVGLAHALPDHDFAPGLIVYDARGPAGIVEFPSAANGWSVVIEFDDNAPGGAYWYDVELDFSSPSGTNYCTSTLNSSGAAASIALTGSLSVAGTDTLLRATDCPAGRPGLFFYGAAPVQLPFADGFLCVSPFAPGLVRLPPTQVIALDGTAESTLDFASLPPNVAITPGSTWYFQFWFRDPAAGGTGSNLSNGVHATFLP